MLDWPLPSSGRSSGRATASSSPGVQLDELYQGTALATREQFLDWFAAAELPEPLLIDLPSGASLVRRRGGPDRRRPRQLTVIVPFIWVWIVQWNG